MRSWQTVNMTLLCNCRVTVYHRCLILSNVAKKNVMLKDGTTVL